VFLKVLDGILKQRFLADRTNGRAIGTLLSPSSVVVCDVMYWCVLDKSYIEVVYEKSVGTKMSDLDLRLEVVSRSCQPLRYIRR